MGFELLLSPHASTPMYAQIMEQIVARVMAGDWKAGQPLPSIRELASDGRVSVITVKRAYLELERAGVIVTRQGKGSFVAEALDVPRTLALEAFKAQLAGLLGTARTLGLSPKDIVDQVEQALSASPSSPADSNGEPS